MFNWSLLVWAVNGLDVVGWTILLLWAVVGFDHVYRWCCYGGLNSFSGPACERCSVSKVSGTHLLPTSHPHIIFYIVFFIFYIYFTYFTYFFVFHLYFNSVWHPPPTHPTTFYILHYIFFIFYIIFLYFTLYFFIFYIIIFIFYVIVFYILHHIFYILHYIFLYFTLYSNSVWHPTPTHPPTCTSLIPSTTFPSCFSYLAFYISHYIIIQCIAPISYPPTH